MKSSSELFELVHALGKSEKRYFKLYSRIYSGNKAYLRLFQILLDQKEYNEEEVLSAFGKKTKGPWLSMAKSRLYNLILKSMESYRSGGEPGVENLTSRAEFLFEKELYSQARKMVDEAKELAFTEEKFAQRLAVFQSLDVDITLHAHDMNRLKLIMDEGNRDLELLLNTKAYFDLYFQIGIEYYKHGLIASKETSKVLDKIMSDPLLQDESKALTFSSRFKFNDCHFLAHYLKGDFDKAVDTAVKIAKMFRDRRKDMDALRTIKYMLLLSNVIIVAQQARNFKRVEEYLGLMNEQKKIFSGTALQDSRVFYLYTSHMLNYTTLTGKFEEYKTELFQLEDELKVQEKKLNLLNRVSLYGSFALLHFALVDYRKALHWMNKIRSEADFKVLPHMQVFIKILYLIVHYELGNQQLIPHLIKSTNWYFKKRKILNTGERILLDFFKKTLPKITNKTKLSEAFRNLLQQVKGAPGAFESNAFGEFDVSAWIEAKVSGKSFAEIVRSKVGN